MRDGCVCPSGHLGCFGVHCQVRKYTIILIACTSPCKKHGVWQPGGPGKDERLTRGSRQAPEGRVNEEGSATDLGVIAVHDDLNIIVGVHFQANLIERAIWPPL